MRCSIFGLLFLMLIISGCSGSSSSDTTAGTVTGIAAAGAPLVGHVTLTDSRGAQRGPAMIDIDGNFSIVTAGLTPPFVVKASGVVGIQPYTLYSIVSEAGQANINPISNAISAIMIGGDPAAVFAASNSIPSGIIVTRAKLQEATNTVRNVLAPLLAHYGVTDFSPITGHYAANPNDPLDAMLDLIMVRTDGGNITITNKLTGGIIAVANITNPANASATMGNAESTAALADVRELTQRLAMLCSVMNLGAALTGADLEDYFMADPAYGTSGGHTRTEDIAGIITIFGPNGTNPHGKLAGIRHLRLVSNLTADYAGRGTDRAYLLNYDFIHDNGVVVHGNDVTFGKESAPGKWKFIGAPVGNPVGNNYGSVFTNQTIDIPTLTFTPPMDLPIVQNSSP